MAGHSSALLAAVLPHYDLIVCAARTAAEEAAHYGGFHVGAAMRVIMPSGGYKVFKGGNQKPSPDVKKICAERVAIDRARTAGAVRVEVVVVTGKLKRDDESGQMGETLHPCGVCRDEVLTAPLIPADTLIITVLHANDGSIPSADLAGVKIELHTRGSLWSFHGDHAHHTHGH